MKSFHVYGYTVQYSTYAFFLMYNGVHQFCVDEDFGPVARSRFHFGQVEVANWAASKLRSGGPVDFGLDFTGFGGPILSWPSTVP